MKNVSVPTDDQIEALAKKHIAKTADLLREISPGMPPYRNTEMFRRTKAFALELLATYGGAVAAQTQPWRDMKTAPQDGTAVIVIIPDSDIPKSVRWKDGCWEMTWDGHQLSGYEQPRYWMPIPSDPDAPGTQQPVSGADGLKISDYEEVLSDHRRLVRDLDVQMNGHGAAQQASLCDIVSQAKRENWKSEWLRRQPSGNAAEDAGGVEQAILDAFKNYERMGEVCSFEGHPMIYAAVLEELADIVRASPPQPSGNAARDDPMERALTELVDKIIPGLDTGDLVADAATAIKVLANEPLINPGLLPVTVVKPHSTSGWDPIKTNYLMSDGSVRTLSLEEKWDIEKAYGDAKIKLSLTTEETRAPMSINNVNNLAVNNVLMKRSMHMLRIMKDHYASKRGPLSETKAEALGDAIAALEANDDNHGTKLATLVTQMFTSGNDIPVERITITRQQYEAAVGKEPK